MTKETVRYPDAVVDHVEELVQDGVFESKSEFYRFSAEYVLDSILGDYDPETFDFEEIVADLDEYGSFGAAGDIGGESDFTDAVLAVRKRALRGEFESAESYIDAAYDEGAIEAVLLEEILARYRAEG